MDKTDKLEFGQIPWIIWKKNSCRIDVFATLAYHIFYYDFTESIFPTITGPALPGELHPLSILLKEMNNASNLQAIQNAIDNYGAYRHKTLKEKTGKGGDIFSLFADLKDSVKFRWTLIANETCECGFNKVRTVMSNPLFTITSALLFSNCGSCSESIKATLSDFNGICPKDKKETSVTKILKEIPQYYCCNLEYTEDLQTGLLQKGSLSDIMIDEYIEYGDIKFDLAAIIYFQELHYTIHLKGIYHPNLLTTIRNEKWFYHDGLKASLHHGSWQKGLLFESNPKLQVEISKDYLKPYILVYRITLNNEI